MIIKLGAEKEATTVNMLQACFWRVMSFDDSGQAIYQITFSGGAVVALSRTESAAFEQFLETSSAPRLIQPVSNLLV